MTWSFDRVERVVLVDAEIGHGTELFSRVLRDSEVMSMLQPFNF